MRSKLAVPFTWLIESSVNCRAKAFSASCVFRSILALLMQLLIPRPIVSILVFSMVLSSWIVFTLGTLHTTLNRLSGGFILQKSCGFCIIMAGSLWARLCVPFDWAPFAGCCIESSRLWADSLMKVSSRRVAFDAATCLRFVSIMFSIACSQISLGIL